MFRKGENNDIATDTTGWTVRGSNPGGGEIFRTRPDRPWGPPSLLYNGYWVFPGGKTVGAWCWPPTPPSAEVENEWSYTSTPPLGTWWPVIGWPLPFTFTMRWLDKPHWNPAVTLRFARISEQRANFFLHINWWSERHGIVLTYWFV
jgi:hypothetical protein